MKVIEISDSHVHKLSDHIEQGLHHLGKAMMCVENLMDDGYMGHRKHDPYMHDSRYGRMHEHKMGMRDYDDDDDEWEDEMAERRHRSRRTGRYI